MSERWNSTVQDKARTIMIYADLPGYLWGEILIATNMIRNISPVTNLFKTPFELWHGKKPDISKLRVLGCKAFCQIKKQFRRGKFAPVSFAAVHIGYGESSPTYRVWNPESRLVYHVGSPGFDEDAAPGWWRKPYKKKAHQYVRVDFPIQRNGPVDHAQPVVDPDAILLGLPLPALQLALPPADHPPVVDAVPPPDLPSPLLIATNVIVPPANVDLPAHSHPLADPVDDDIAPESASAPSSPSSTSPPPLFDDDDDVPGEESPYFTSESTDSENEHEPEQVQTVRRSTRPNRGVPSGHFSNMLMIAYEGITDKDPPSSRP